MRGGAGRPGAARSTTTNPSQGRRPRPTACPSYGGSTGLGQNIGPSSTPAARGRDHSSPGSSAKPNASTAILVHLNRWMRLVSRAEEHPHPLRAPDARARPGDAPGHGLQVACGANTPEAAAQYSELSCYEREAVPRSHRDHQTPPNIDSVADEKPRRSAAQLPRRRDLWLFRTQRTAKSLTADDVPWRMTRGRRCRAYHTTVGRRAQSA